MIQVRSTSSQALNIFTAAGLVVYGTGICLAHSHALGIGIRVAGLIILAFVAIQRRSIATWTLFAILAGTELGADAPRVAVRLHVLAEIFLRLVRLIVAPLILGTLTTGIAAHGGLRHLGRIAWKTFLYFEVVTTLALLLGARAGAISIGVWVENAEADLAEYGDPMRPRDRDPDGWPRRWRGSSP